MAEERARDLVLAPEEFVYIQDTTKGVVNTYVGPMKASLSQTERPVKYDRKSRRFYEAELRDAIQGFANAPDGWYVALENPAKDGSKPTHGTTSILPVLEGRKVNIHGPVKFALWPGQICEVIEGHRLRSNQYLVSRVYDSIAAKEQWGNAVVSAVMEGEEKKQDLGEKGLLAIGQLLIIKGTEVSFFMPPTGMEVVPEGSGYVQEALTLERLDYCILLDENGNKRFVQGPDVVFPAPTEAFVVKESSRKFRAIELNEISGIYVKVIADYEEEGKKYKAGQELFITGRNQMIYYPREEHAIIRYGDTEVHHATAVPVGEGRYVLDRMTGNVMLECGPNMLLPDPRDKVIVRRKLDDKTVGLWYPENQEAQIYNEKLRTMTKDIDYVTERAFRSVVAPAFAALDAEPVKAKFAGDAIARKTSYTKPRSIVLDQKYDGVPRIDVWTGYAILVKSATGKRRVVVGPQPVLLEYDEVLERVALSTGKPKNTDHLYETVFLRVLNNKIGDIIVGVETKDLCSCQVKVSYCVDFEGDPERWFNVENYVKYLCDHMRSVIKNVVKKKTIHEFYQDSISIVRDAVLGMEADERGKRRRVFEENGMVVKDVEVLMVEISDPSVSAMLVNAQHEAVKRIIDLTQEEERLLGIKRKEVIKREGESCRAETDAVLCQLRKEKMEQESILDRLGAELANQLEEQNGNARIVLAEMQRALTFVRNDVDLALHELRMKREGDEQVLALESLEKQTQAFVSKLNAIQPELVAAMQAFADKELIGKVTQSMAPVAIMGGQSVQEVVANLLRGTPLSHLLRGWAAGDRKVEQ